MIIYINSTAILLKVDNGVQAIFDDEGNYEFGEFVAAKDFNDDAFTSVESDLIEAVDFNGNAYYQRQLTKDIYNLVPELFAN